MPRQTCSKLPASPAAGPLHLEIALSVAFAFVLVTARQGSAASSHPRVNPTAPTLKDFSDRVQKYVELQQKLDSQLPKVGSTDDPAKIEAHRKALPNAIPNARRDARAGDIFGEAAHLVRRIIRQDAKIRPVRDAFAVMQEVPKSAPRVNAEYPEKAPFATVPPLILTRLPQLPDGIEYRFMGRDLILRDAQSNLIVDYVHEAAPTIRQ